ncbi:hypothetical protein B0H19DRAFT_1371282, partial [Mycena capillaripes]
MQHHGKHYGALCSSRHYGTTIGRYAAGHYVLSVRSESAFLNTRCTRGSSFVSFLLPPSLSILSLALLVPSIFRVFDDVPVPKVSQNDCVACRMVSDRLGGTRGFGGGHSLLSPMADLPAEGQAHRAEASDELQPLAPETRPLAVAELRAPSISVISVIRGQR